MTRVHSGENTPSRAATGGEPLAAAVTAAVPSAPPLPLAPIKAEAVEMLTESPPPPPEGWFASWFGRAEPEPELEEAEPLSPFSALRAARELELKTLASP